MITSFKASHKTETFTKRILIRVSDEPNRSSGYVNAKCLITGAVERNTFIGENLEAEAKAFYESIVTGPKERVYAVSGRSGGDYADMSERMDGQL